MALQTREFLTQVFLASLREAQLPWHQCWTDTAPVSLNTGKPYRGVNNVLLSYVAGRKDYTDPRWLTYHQAQERGWQVRRGENSAKVEYWHYYDARLKTELEPAQVKLIQRKDPQRMRDIRLVAHAYSVFNGQQVDGIPKWEPAPTTVHVKELVRQRNQLVLNLGVGFREGGNRAYYAPLRDEITLPPAEYFEDDYAYASTLLHEAGHATGHYTRLNRPFANAIGTSEYAKEELRAEIASAFAAQAMGIPRSDRQQSADLSQHKAYLQSWIGILEQDPGALYAAIKDAEKIADYLMERGKVLELAQGAQEEHLDKELPEVIQEEPEYEP